MDEDFKDEKYSDDPEEQLRIENDILKLKIQAELGGDFEGDADLPADVENIFLKNVLEFEHKQANAPVKTLFEILESPSFTSADVLGDDEIDAALTAIESLMQEKGIVVDYGTEYPARVKYQFITEELFEKEAPVIDMPGMTMHYVYEDFHPNHALDIEGLVEDFYRHWIDKNFDGHSTELASDLILEDGSSLSKYTLLDKLSLVFESYEQIIDPAYSISILSYEMHEDGKGLGYVEGSVGYDALLESGEVQHFEGPFKFYVQYIDSWSIFFFNWPGFMW